MFSPSAAPTKKSCGWISQSVGGVRACFWMYGIHNVAHLLHAMYSVSIVWPEYGNLVAP